MRKRINILLTGVSIALAGCVEEKVDNNLLPEEISFQVVRAPSARGDMTGKTEYPKDLPFGAYAYFLPAGSTWDADKASAEVYINDVEISYDATNANWHAATTYYWPKQGSLTFFAYSPKTIASHAGFSYDKEGITLNGWDINANPNVDFMVADIAKNKRGNEDNYAYNGVPTLFRHKLARVSVKAKLDDMYENKTINLTSVELTNIKTTGNYVNNNWTGQGAPENIQVYNDASGRLLNKDSVIGIGTQKRIVMPQALAQDAYFKIKYDLITTTAGGGTDTQLIEKDILIKNVTPAWYMNNDITYTLIISLGTNYIEFDTSVTDWVGYGNTDLTIE